MKRQAAKDPKEKQTPFPRFCILLESYYPVVGGMETQGRTLVQGLCAQGVKVTVVTRRTSSELAREEEIDGVKVYRAGPCGRSSRNRWFFMLTCIPLLIKLRKKYDVLLVSGFRVLGISAVRVARLLKKKVVLKAECMGEMSGAFFTGGLQLSGMKRGSWLFRSFLKWRNRGLLKADHFISMYSDMDEEFKSYGIPSDRITTIANAVDIKQYAPVEVDAKRCLREKLNLPRDKTLVIYTGRIVSYKGLPMALKVWKERFVEDSDTLLVIVGEGGVDVYNCEDDARHFVEVNKLQSVVRFTGPVTNVYEYMKACDIFLLPTENDAFPLCIIEAMASALPIITTPVGALKDVIKDGETGLIIEPANPDALKQALERILKQPRLAKTMGEKARDQVKRCYTREAVVNQYLELVRKL